MGKTGPARPRARCSPPFKEDMFIKIPYSVIKDIPFITAFDVYAVQEQIAIEQVYKEYK